MPYPNWKYDKIDEWLTPHERDILMFLRMTPDAFTCYRAIVEDFSSGVTASPATVQVLVRAELDTLENDNRGPRVERKQQDSRCPNEDPQKPAYDSYKAKGPSPFSPQQATILHYLRMKGKRGNWVAFSEICEAVKASSADDRRRVKDDLVSFQSGGYVWVRDAKGNDKEYQARLVR